MKLTSTTPESENVSTTERTESEEPKLSPVKIIIVEKLGSLRELQVKQYKEEDLFKKAGFKSPNNFLLRHEFKIDNTTQVRIYGKLSGIVGQENRYELPPPLENILFFGNCVLVKYVEGIPTNMNMHEWNEIYSKLFGGFESLTDEDSEQEEENQDLKALSEITRDIGSNKISFTKEGYAKDNFVVDDKEEVEGGDEGAVVENKTFRVSSAAIVSSENNDVVVMKKKRNSKLEGTAASPKPSGKVKKVSSKTEQTDGLYFQDKNELQKEPYI